MFKMKILIASRPFYPSTGGSEKNAEILAFEWLSMGHCVKVVTQTRNKDPEEDRKRFPFEITRGPKRMQFLRLMQWCDVYFQNGISLRDAWPLLIIRRPWVIRHGGWIRNLNGNLKGIGGSDRGWISRLKQYFTRYATSISVSHAIAVHLKQHSYVLPNPYQDDLFRVLPYTKRHRELVFLGRLVSEKGVSLLLDSLSLLRDQALMPHLTIIGKGPEEPALREKTIGLQLNEQVQFVGVKSGEALVKILNEHQLMVIPSIYDEPSGNVALQGAACGCVIVGSHGGGLAETIGPCGVTFPNGDLGALTKILKKFLIDPNRFKVFRKSAEGHLKRHRKKVSAQAYLNVIQKVIMRR